MIKLALETLEPEVVVEVSAMEIVRQRVPAKAILAILTACPGKSSSFPWKNRKYPYL